MQPVALSPAGGVVWRNVPNAISLARILATPFLLGLALLHRPDMFKWVLLACLLSDIVDGLIARVFHLRSRLGAFLDSTADMLVLLIAATGIWIFQKPFLSAHYFAVFVAIGLYLAEMLAAFMCYGKISSFHTILTRIAAYAQGIFIMVLFLWGYRGWIFYPAIALAVLASTEEFVLLFLLPQWKSDVRGLYWVLSRKAMAS